MWASSKMTRRNLQLMSGPALALFVGAGSSNSLPSSPSLPASPSATLTLFFDGFGSLGASRCRSPYVVMTTSCAQILRRQKSHSSHAPLAGLFGSILALVHKHSQGRPHPLDLALPLRDKTLWTHDQGRAAPLNANQVGSTVCGDHGDLRALEG